MSKEIQFEYTISFPDSDASPAMRELIEEQFMRLSRFYNRITSGHVQVRIPHKHGGVRNFHVHIQLDVPGKRLAVSREPEKSDDHTDPAVAIRDAFHKLTRQLEDFVRTRKDH